MCDNLVVMNALCVRHYVGDAIVGIAIVCYNTLVVMCIAVVCDNMLVLKLYVALYYG